MSLFNFHDFKPPRLISPLNLVIWQTALLLITHPDSDYVLSGIEFGFALGTQSGVAISAKRNCSSAYAHPDRIARYLLDELSFNSIAGPFDSPPCEAQHVNRFGVIPKSTPGKFRLITDLSFPRGGSVNDLIPDSEAAVSYVGIPEAISSIMQLGPGTLLAKFDIQRAYRLLPVCPAQRYLLGMCWKGAYFVDLAIPFGLRSAPRIFSRFADVLLAILKAAGGGAALQNYLDDFLVMGPADSAQCHRQLETCLTRCAALGVPIAAGKTEGPATTLIYLGFVLDTVKLELQLPLVKLEKVRSALTLWSGRKRGSKRELLSLIGLLQHCCQAVVHGRPFLRRLIDKAHSVAELHQFVSLSSWERDDLDFWLTLLRQWNGKSLFFNSVWEKAPDLSVSSDAAGSLGFAAINGLVWFAKAWPSGVSQVNIAVKEFVPIVLAAHIWGSSWARKRIVFKCDNSAVVAVLQRGLCKDRHLAYLLRELTIYAVLHSFTFHAVHIPGVYNVHADALSRFNFQLFRASVPNADSSSLTIPDWLLTKLLHPPWTSNGKV